MTRVNPVIVAILILMPTTLKHTRLSLTPPKIHGKNSSFFQKLHFLYQIFSGALNIAPNCCPGSANYIERILAQPLHPLKQMNTEDVKGADYL